MARKTAIRITSAEIAKKEHAADSRRDRRPRRKLSTADVLKVYRARKLAETQSRDAATVLTESGQERALTDDERAGILRRRCGDAARLAMLGDQFSPDDRLDCQSQLLARILADFAPVIPPLGHERVSLSILVRRAGDIRRTLERDRARDHETFLRDRAEVAASPDAEALKLAAEIAELRRAERLSDAATAAAEIAARLDLAETDAAAPLFQWLADVDGRTCAELHGMTAASWRVKVSRGGKLLRERAESAAAMLSVLLDDDAEIIERTVRVLSTNEHGRASRVAPTGFDLDYGSTDASTAAAGPGSTYAGAKLRETAAEWREGTAAGVRPIKPETADDARSLCRVRKVKPQTAAAAARRARQSTDHTETLDMGGRRRRITVDGRTRQQAEADARRAIAREHVRQTRRREKSVTTDRESTPKRGAPSFPVKKRAKLAA